ncbi:MAG: hypothetical protein EOP87_24085 [Verrucomicrobiaceae bacterium]|nr:MAG: hypothetical protein EOP87_24085 [Verrucomicrobiaceae bacterium]
MKNGFLKAGAMSLSAALTLSAVGCFPVYPPGDRGYAYNQDAKGYDVQQESPPPRGPAMVGVDPALLVAGAAAAGLLGYAIGNNHHHHHGYYGPGPYGGYYGPRYYYR